jgi:hypothetical protein
MVKYSDLSNALKLGVAISIRVLGRFVNRDIENIILQEIKLDKLCARCWKREENCKCNAEDWKHKKEI